MTNWPPLRAGTPKLSAAGPDRNVTMPSLKVSCANAGAASVSVAATARIVRLVRQAWSMISSPMCGCSTALYLHFNRQQASAFITANLEAIVQLFIINGGRDEQEGYFFGRRLYRAS